MRIELRDENRGRIGRIDVDPSLRPTRVSVVGADREVFLNWDIALDDGGHLRRCVACGCTDLYRERAFPQITGFVVAVAFVLGVVGTLGLATTTPMLIGMAAVLVIDVGILLFSRVRLVCYQCGTTYHGLPVARYHRAWDRATADRHPPPAKVAPPEPRAAPAPSAPAARPVA